MDKNAIKKFAVWARRELISRVSQKAALYGITEKDFGTIGADSVNGRVLVATETRQRDALIRQIRKNGYEQVMEEVAYTWFNRFCALRYMEVNGYLPTHVRVFTDDAGAFKPQILAEAINLELDGLDPERVYALKTDNQDEALYRYLLIAQCNALNAILPGMFQRIEDYTELLLPENLLRTGSVVEQLVSAIPEADWTDQVQIIGWLYQYYNAEKKDDVFAALKKNVKITKENIPAATQLFTPDWIVRYMVENSLGRLWVEGHPNAELKSNWKYYVEDAEQEPEVQAQLAEIHREYAALKPEDIRCIDPCMGSGHILVYMFDVLMQIYEAYGYTARDAAQSIVEHNLYGLDIDDRAAQLAYFAVMMKARSHDRRFFSRACRPKVYSICESNDLDAYAVAYFCDGDANLKASLQSIVEDLHDAKEYGSILNVRSVDFAALYARFDVLAGDAHISSPYCRDVLLPLVQVAETLARKYHAVVTNPPYMGSDSMSQRLREKVILDYPDSRYDMYTICMERFRLLVEERYCMAMITQYSFLYSYCFRNFRKQIIEGMSFVNAVALGPKAFEEISGEVVQSIAFVLMRERIDQVSPFVNLVTFPTDKERHFFESNHLLVRIQDFKKFENYVFAYSLTGKMKDIYLKNKRIGDVFESRAGVVTGKDDFFLRLWYEVSFPEFSISNQSISDKYVPYSKGGSFLRWYGNVNYALRIKDLYDDSLVNKSVRRGDKTSYFRKSIGWSQMGGGNDKKFSILQNCICGTASPVIFSEDENQNYFALGFLNSKIPSKYIEAFNPLLSTYISDVCNLPYIKFSFDECIVKVVKECINISRIGWDSFETSWDFRCHPLVRLAKRKDDGV